MKHYQPLLEIKQPSNDKDEVISLPDFIKQMEDSKDKDRVLSLFSSKSENFFVSFHNYKFEATDKDIIFSNPDKEFRTTFFITELQDEVLVHHQGNEYTSYKVNYKEDTNLHLWIVIKEK